MIYYAILILLSTLIQIDNIPGQKPFLLLYSGIHTPCNSVFWHSMINFGAVELKFCICSQLPYQI